MTATQIRILRKSLGLTQAEFAELIGMSRIQIMKFEAGHPQGPQSALLLRLMVEVPGVAEWLGTAKNHANAS